jgi:hypothetical protein
MMIIVLWDVTSRSLEYRYRRLGGTCFFHLQDTLTSHPNNNTSPPSPFFNGDKPQDISFAREAKDSFARDAILFFIAV